MLHIIQVVISGFAEIPQLFIDEAAAESGYIEGTKKYWPQAYSAYCAQNNIQQDSLASAKSFVKSFDVAEKSKINHWVVKPEDIGLDKLNLLLLGDKAIQERRKHIQALSDDLECRSTAVKKELAAFFGKCADLVEHINSFDTLLGVGQPECGADCESDLDSPVPPQAEPEVRDEKYNTPEWQQFIGSIKNLCGGGWSEFPLFSRHDWRQEVYGNSTSFEYWEWAATKIDDCIGKAEKAGYSVVEDADQQGHYLFNTIDGVESEISYTSEVEAWCHASFHLDGSEAPQE